MDLTPSCLVVFSWAFVHPLTHHASTIADGIEETKKCVNKIIRYLYHILQLYLPDRPDIHYNLTERYHNKTLNPKTADLNERRFQIRNLYKRTY